MVHTWGAGVARGVWRPGVGAVQASISGSPTEHTGEVAPTPGPLEGRRGQTHTHERHSKPRGWGFPSPRPVPALPCVVEAATGLCPYLCPSPGVLGEPFMLLAVGTPTFWKLPSIPLILHGASKPGHCSSGNETSWQPGSRCPRPVTKEAHVCPEADTALSCLLTRRKCSSEKQMEGEAQNQDPHRHTHLQEARGPRLRGELA